MDRGGGTRRTGRSSSGMIIRVITTVKCNTQTKDDRSRTDGERQAGGNEEEGAERGGEPAGGCRLAREVLVGG